MRPTRRRSRAPRAPTSRSWAAATPASGRRIRIKQREPSCDVVVLEQDICGGGASGRNGGFALSWWAKLGTLVELCGREGALAIAQGVGATRSTRSGRSATSTGSTRDYHRGGHLWTATSQAQLGAWDGRRRPAASSA